MFAKLTWSQTVVLSGKVIANEDVENIHVINVTSNVFTITNAIGTFNIKAKYQDTLVFSSVRYKTRTVIVSYTAVQNKTLDVYLEEQINLLDEVVVGKVLTGDLESDLENFKVDRPIDFYDVGLPGYTGKPKTQSERRLYAADAGKFVYYYGIAFSINVNKILNRISGRTKMLKDRVDYETRKELMLKLKAEYSEILFNENTLEIFQQVDYFYFCSDDENFLIACRTIQSLETLEFLKEKLEAYNENLKENKD